MNSYKLIKIAAVMGALLGMTSCCLHPQPITQCERTERIVKDKVLMFANQEPIYGEITLSEAMARALKYNLDLRLKTADAILARNDFNVTRYDMLPDVVASAGYLSRSNEYAVKTDPTSDIISFSQDRHRRVADLQLTWNILDFGVSYIRARQKGDEFLISIERRRKMEQNIVRDVRYAYFRAVSAQKVVRKINPLLGKVRGAIRKSKRLETEQTQDPLQALQYQKTLLETLRQLTTLKRELANAKRELASLMNTPPGQKFRVSEEITGMRTLPRSFPTKGERLEYLALQHRPELREEDYRTRMSVNEVLKAKLEMLPGLEVTGGQNYDSNSFLVNNDWTNVGSQLVWNLMRIVSAPANIERAKREVIVSNTRRLALSMAILTQVDVASIRYHEVRSELDVTKTEKDVLDRIYARVSKAYRAKKSSELDLIQAQTDLILAHLRYDLVYSEWQNSAGQLLNSVGYDILPIVNTTQSVGKLRRQIHAALNVEPTWLLRARIPGEFKLPRPQPAMKTVYAKKVDKQEQRYIPKNYYPGVVLPTPTGKHQVS